MSQINVTASMQLSGTAYKHKGVTGRVSITQTNDGIGGPGKLDVPVAGVAIDLTQYTEARYAFITNVGDNDVDIGMDDAGTIKPCMTLRAGTSDIAVFPPHTSNTLKAAAIGSDSILEIYGGEG